MDVGPFFFTQPNPTQPTNLWTQPNPPITDLREMQTSPSVDYPRGTVYLQRCDQLMSLFRLLEHS